MIPVGLILRIAPWVLLVAAILFGIHRIRADAVDAERTRARASALETGYRYMHGLYSRSAAASVAHAKSIQGLDRRYAADKRALAASRLACLDSDLPDDLRSLLRDSGDPVSAPADPPGTVAPTR